MSEKLLKLINDFFSTDFNHGQTTEIKPDTLPKWDSLAHLNLVLCIEDEFGVVFEPTEIAEMLGGYNYIVGVLSKKGVK